MDAQVGGGLDHNSTFEGEEAALLGDVRANDGLAGDGGVFLLDEALGEFHHGGVFIGAIVGDDVLGVFLRVIRGAVVVEVEQFAAHGAVRGDSAPCPATAGHGLADVQADEGLLQLEVVKLHAGVFVKGFIVGGEAIGRFIGAASLLGVAVLQGGIAEFEHLLGLLGF